MVRGAVLGAALLLGCGGGSEARRYAVTFTDAAIIDCRPETEGLNPGDADDVEDLTGKLEKEWKEGHEADPPRPFARELVISTVEETVSGWLDEPLVTYNRFGATYFAGRDEVLTGALQEDYIDVQHARVLNDDESLEAADLPLCGDRTHATSTLLLTVDGGAVEGRLRRVEIWYPVTTFFSCDARISCARNIAAIGAETTGP